MFQILNWDYREKDNAVAFQFESATHGHFTETVTFPEVCRLGAVIDTPECRALVDLAAFYVGISYYKTAAENRLVSKLALSSSSQASVVALYTDGLGEFYARNALDFPPDLTVEIPQLSSNTIESLTLHTREASHPEPLNPIVAFGGGKDSHVALSLLQRAAIEYTVVSVVLAEAVKERLAAMTDQTIHWIHRTIDPRLITLNQSDDVYNGHIPITAINSVLLSIMAMGTGANAVVFSNERGASVATREYRGHPVNHQYSKSLEFEQYYRKALWSIAENRLDYFSVLRGYSELWIARYAATEVTGQHHRMASCNRNFVFSGPKALPSHQRWCGQCSKCVFSAIIFAPHLSKAEFIALFDADILNDADNITHANNLTGLGTAKPWECVGDMQDTASSIAVLSDHAEWSDSVVVSSLIKTLPAHYDVEQLKQRYDEQLVSYTQNCVPDALQQTLLAAL